MERGIQQFDAWAANFGETRTELELQPSGLYKPVTRFCEFVNVPDLMAIYRMATDVVLKSDLRQYLKLPADRWRTSANCRCGRLSEAFLSATSATSPSASRRLKNRSRQTPEGRRHPALGHHRRPPRRDRPCVLFNQGSANDPDNKLNALINNVHRIWEQTANNPLHPSRRRSLTRYPARSQMIFLRPWHARRRRNPWLLRLSLDQGFPCRPRRAIGSDRLHAGLQDVLGEAALVQRRQWRPGSGF